MPAFVGLFFDVAVLAALGAAIFYCFRLSGQINRMRADRKVTLPLDRYARDYYDGRVATDDVPLLTDNYAPVDILPVYGWEPERTR